MCECVCESVGESVFEGLCLNQLQGKIRVCMYECVRKMSVLVRLVFKCELQAFNSACECICEFKSTVLVFENAWC